MKDTRRSGLLLAFTTAIISGFAVFLNGFGVKAVGNATTYTTLKNCVALIVIVAVVAVIGMNAGVSGRHVVTRPATAMQWCGLGVIGVLGGAVASVLDQRGVHP